MSQGFEIIRARIKDSAVVLIDRLMRSKQQEIILVLPKNSIIATDLNSLKILKEETESIGKTLSLNTENSEIKSFAKKIKMLIYDHNSSYKDKGQVKQIKKIKIMTDILPPSFNRALENDVADEIKESPEELPEEPEPDYKLPPEPVIYEVTNQNSDLEKDLENFYIKDFKNNELKPESRWRGFYLNHMISFFAISGFLLFGAAMYLILPKVDVKISLKEVPLKTQITVAVSKNISSSNLSSGIIPGQYFSLNKTGSKIIEGRSQIGGIIEIYNAYSAIPQKLVANTRFETKDGKIFRTQNPVIIPGARMSGANLIPSSIKTKVIADLPAGRQVATSDEYLIGPSFFTIPGFKGTPKYAGFYAKSVESMAATQNTFINKEELEKNKNELKNKLAQELKSDILSTLKDSDLQLVDGASIIKIDDFKVSKNTISMKITWQALFFKERDLRTMIDYFISSHYPDLKNFTFKDNIAYPEVSRADFKKGELFFTFNIDKNNALPADLDGLKKELAGRDENGMRTIISDKKYVNSASISLWPFWVSRAPNNLKKINITIDN